ncbi:MAG: DNA repair protein RadC [Candidatus Brocadiia bacterium]
MHESSVQLQTKPYGRLYERIRARGAGPSLVQERDPGALTEFCRRLGAFPRSWTGDRADEAAEMVVQRMALGADASPEQVRADLAAFCSESAPDAVCGPVPLCGECPVEEFCDYPDRRLTIKELPRGERPRERLLEQGAEALSDGELLALIIGGGSSKATAVDLAKRLLRRFGGFRQLTDCTAGQLRQVHGIGPAKAARIQAALAIARRYAAQKMEAGMHVRGSEQLARYMGEKLAGLRKECFMCLTLDIKNKLIREERIAVGSLNESIVHPREVFRNAIRESAAKVVFVHNHPSGNPEPSAEDRRLTDRLRQVGRLVGIPVLDHIIVGGERYYSFAENGTLDGAS